MTTTRPYKVFGAVERSALAEATGAVLASWSEAWLAAGVRAQGRCTPAAEQTREDADWVRFASGEKTWWIVVDRGAFAATLFGCSSPSSIAATVADAALRELVAALVGAQPAALRSDGTQPPAHLWEKGSAAAALDVALGACRLRLVSSPEWTAALLRERLPRPAPVKLESRREAVAGRAVALQVVAGRLELELGALRGLAPGNVIALGTRIDTPLGVVRTGAGAALFRARLGSTQGARAIVAVGART